MRKSFFAVVALLCVAAPLRADDLTGRFAVGGAVGGAVPTGSHWVRDHAELGPVLGGFVRYGIDKNWGVGLSYDNVGFRKDDVRVQPILVNGYYNLKPDSRFNPNVHLGVGGSDVKHDEFSRHKAFTAKLGLGADYFFHKNVAVGGFLDYLPVWRGNRNEHEIHSFLFGLTLAWWFDPCGCRKAPAQAAAPAPVVGITLTPASATLGQGAGQPFSAPVSGTSNQGVRWSIDPKVGTISDSGVYTAPAVITQEQTVAVRATSAADPSKSASSQVRLVPPAKKETVSIKLLIEFDTAKSVVKAQYDDQLKKVSDFLKTYPETKAEIEGHTDSMGNHDYNMKLSQERADAVRQALISRFSVAAERLTAKGYGPTKPVADNATPEGRSQNRRVLATFTGLK